MKLRTFGRTGNQVSEIGYGTWGFGGMWGARDDAQAVASLNRAIELGVTFFDTAAVYGEGHSETLIGNVVRKKRCRDQVFLATKVPPKNFEWPARSEFLVEDVFPGEWIREITEKSLRHLQVDTLDLQQLHVWSSGWLGKGDWWETLQKLKEEGKIRQLGISINDHQPDTALELVSSGLIDSVQVIYNIFDQSAAEKLFPLCLEKKVAVIVRVPFDEGSLADLFTPDTQFSKKDWRKHYFKGDRLKETCDRVSKLKEFLNDETKTLSDLALKFCLAEPAVTTVIPGMRRLESVERNVSVSDQALLSKDTLEGLRAQSWVRNYYLR